jgi:hypothetical protein
MSKIYDFILKLGEEVYAAKRVQIESMYGECVIPEDKTEK